MPGPGGVWFVRYAHVPTYDLLILRKFANYCPGEATLFSGRVPDYHKPEINVFRRPYRL